MSNREKILDTALTLFNDQGTAAVSTNHIAEAAGISPGNLYYHFKNKEEIIRELFERLFAANDAGYQLPTDRPPTLDDLKGIIRFLYKILWEYRFIYRETLALLQNDAALKARFLIIRKRGFEGFYELVHAFAEAGIITLPENQEAIDNLAEITWLIAEFWLNSLELSGKTINKAQMERGVGLMMQVLEPYIK